MSDMMNRRDKTNFCKIALFSRRQFFQRLGISLGGAIIGGIALSSACKSRITSTLSTTSSQPFTIPDSSETISQSTVPVTTASIITSLTSSGTPPASISGGAYVPYKAPSTAAPVLRVPGTDCTVATDRGYSIDHVWVKLIAPDLAVMGVTPSFVKLIYPYRVSLSETGANVPQNDTFGLIEGYKTTADLITPAAGKIMENNRYLVAQGKSDTIPLLDSDPYSGGWMVVLRLSKPDELKGLITPQAYLERLLKII